MFTFSNPLAFLLLSFFPLYAFSRLAGLKTLHFKFAILNWKTEQQFQKNFMLKLVRAFFMLAIFFTIISLSGPELRYKKHLFFDNDATIMFVIDVSPSMSIKDMDVNGKKESRLEVAKKCVNNFVDANENICVGLTLFASESSLLIPETINHKVFVERLKSIELGCLGEGTALGNGLATALLHSSKNKNSYFIVLTDGENNSGIINPLSVAKIIADRKIHFYLIGIGTEGQAKITFTNRSESKTYSGISNKSFDEARLKDLALHANGYYKFANSYEAILDVVHIVSKNLEGSISKRSVIKTVSLGKYLTFLSFILLSLSWFIKKIVLKAVL